KHPFGTRCPERKESRTHNGEAVVLYTKQSIFFALLFICKHFAYVRQDRMAFLRLPYTVIMEGLPQFPKSAGVGPNLLLVGFLRYRWPLRGSRVHVHPWTLVPGWMKRDTTQRTLTNGRASTGRFAFANF